VGAIGVLGVAAIGLVDLVGAPTGAQSADVRAELVSVDAGNVALSGSNTNPSISDAGSVVVFTNQRPAAVSEPPEYDLIVRKKAVDAAAVEVVRVDLNSSHPVAAAVSGDGCTMAYSVMVDRPVLDPPADLPGGAGQPAVDGGEAGAAPIEPEVVELRTVALCGTAGIEPEVTVLDRVEGATPFTTPSLSADGATVVWAVRDAVRSYAGTSTPEAADFIEVAAPGPDFMIGGHLDMTADGSTIVFEAGPLTADPDDPADAIDPSVFITTITAPAVATDPTVVATELFAPSDAGSSWPTISGDGALVVYQSDQPLPIAGVPADGNYLVLADRSVAPVAHRVLTTGAVRPALAANGTALVYDVFESVQLRRSDSVAPFAGFTERIANPKVGVDFDEGAAASVTGAVLSADGGVVVFDQPAAAQLSTPVLVDAHVWSQQAAPLFAPPPTSTTIDNTTTSTIAVTQPTVSVPTTPRTTTRNTPRTTTRNTPRTTTRNTTRPTSPSTTAPAQLATFVPAAFEFAPTIINAGRRTASVDLLNSTVGTVSVTSIAIDVAGTTDFAAEPAGCLTLAPGERCVVVLTFAPTVTGELTANVVATFSDGTTTTAALRGVGAPEPTVSVQPGVASSGQVVTIFGSGFPAGASIDLDWHDGQVRSVVVIDDLGGFAEPLVILPNTTSGPAEVFIAGQVDLFGDVTTTVLVSGSSSRGNTAVLGGGIAGGAFGR
jgi:hypothetical protein